MTNKTFSETAPHYVDVDQSKAKVPGQSGKAIKSEVTRIELVGVDPACNEIHKGKSL